jgi:RNA polymerase sigma factor (sigma-70 family)
MSDDKQTRMTLVERIRDQYDNLAWEEFVEIYEPYIYAIIRRMGISAEESKDIHQNVLLQIWKKLPEYKKIANTRFRGWICTVTANAVRYYVRSKTNKSKVIDRLGNEDEWNGSSQQELDAIADEEWEFFLAQAALENVRKGYSGKAVDVFLLSVSGKSIQEISSALELEESSVYQLRARVKKSLTKEVARLREELS